jgi:hypothetical protein
MRLDNDGGSRNNSSSHQQHNQQYLLSSSSSEYLLSSPLSKFKIAYAGIENRKRHLHKSYVYEKILLPRFDKHIEITRTNNSSSKIDLLLNVKEYDNNYGKDRSRFYYLKKVAFC